MRQKKKKKKKGKEFYKFSFKGFWDGPFVWSKQDYSPYCPL